jgi:hypothetical protein
MDRPGVLTLASTGLSKAPIGSTIERPERPNTASSRRAGSGGGQIAAPPQQLPGTAARPSGTAAGRSTTAAGAPPGSAFRRNGTGALDAAAAAAAATAPRPLTQQGVGGLIVKPATAAAGRQVRAGAQEPSRPSLKLKQSVISGKL